ncbi:hypothetical protein OH805_00180 [Streptomyces sp. NBC_00879]|uniref:hypothetical protein n=1 Tax=Streptomyces sp. NBC_00879 TaxID=2975855 RepID=UPI00386DC727|nr:hypothetical protein OH805_00180 [Streptomyces sp. NBC_00879]
MSLSADRSVAPSPTYQEPERLAAELRDLAGNPRCAVHARALRRLADAVKSGREDELRVWAGGGLIAAYCGPDTLTAAPSAATGRGRRLVSALPSVLVFAPLLFTWAGLGAAAYAYQQMRDVEGNDFGGNGPSGSFLSLWQQGFDGHLWPVLHFDMMVVYTVVALLGLMGTTVLGRVRDTAEESERRQLMPRLSGALAQVEALAARAAHASPARFATELQGAATGLRDLLSEAARVQERAHNLLSEAGTATEQHLAAAKALESAVAALQAGTTDLRASVGSATQAAGEVAAGTRLLTEELARSGAAMAEGVDKAGRLAAERLGAAGEMTAERIDRAAREARERDKAAGDRTAEWMRQAVQEVTGSLTAVRASTAESTQVLASTLDGLDRTLARLPAALEGAAAEGADRIGTAYDLAVAAMAVSLRDEVRTVTAELGARITDLRDAALLHQDGQAETHTRLLDTLEQLHGALRALAKALPQHPPAPPASPMAPVPSVPPVPSALPAQAASTAPPAASASSATPVLSAPSATPAASASSAPPAASASSATRPWPSAPPSRPHRSHDAGMLRPVAEEDR